MQLPGLLYRVAGSLDGRRDVEQLATDLNAELGQELTAEQVSFLVEERLGPVGIVARDATDAETPAAPVRSDPLLALRYRVGVVPPSVVWRVAGALRPFYWRPVWIGALATFVAFDVWIVLQGDLLGRFVTGVESLIQRPVLTLVILALGLLSGAFHECGHVAACRYGGARPGDMGIGLYIVWPAMYSTVTDAYRLDRIGRLRTDLGGVYFNAIFMAGLSILYLRTGEPWLLLAIIGLHTETAWQFLPSIRLDGYYILADLVGVPDLFAYLGPVLKSLIPGRPTHPQVRELRPWSRRLIVLWVVLVVPTLLFYLVAFLIIVPQVLPLVWTEVLKYLNTLDAAARAGDVVTTTLSMFQLFLLVLPWIGTVLITTMIFGMLRQRAVARWGRGRVRVGTWSAVRRYAARAAVGGLALALVARVAYVMTALPASPGETRVTERAFAALRLGAGVAPTVDPAEFVLRAQLVGYAHLTGAFDRHTDVLAGGRELAVLASAVLVGCLLVFAAGRRLRLLAVAMPLVAAAAMGPAVAAVATLSPGVVGAAWTALGALVLARARGRAVLVGLGAAAVVAGLATAPLLTVPLAAGAVAMIAPGGRWGGQPRNWRLLVAAVAVLAGAAVLRVTPTDGGTALGGSERDVLLLVAAVIVAGGLAVARVRPAAAAAGSVVALAALPWSGAGGALPLVAVATVGLGVLLVDALAGGPVQERPHPLLRAALVVPVVVVTMVGALFLPVRVPTLPHAELAAWITAPESPATTVAAPPWLWADLLRDGVPADRLHRDGSAAVAPTDWTVAVGDPGPDVRGQAVQFGNGQGALTVRPPEQGDERRTPADREQAARRAAGQLLAGNPRLTAPPEVLAALRDGSVDSRSLILLAALTSQHAVSVGAAPPAAGEEKKADVPRHVLLVSGLDGRPIENPRAAAALKRWLRVQQPPFAPSTVTVGPSGALVGWSLPAPPTLLAPSQ